MQCISVMRHNYKLVLDYMFYLKKARAGENILKQLIIPVSLRIKFYLCY